MIVSFHKQEFYEEVKGKDGIGDSKFSQIEFYEEVKVKDSIDDIKCYVNTKELFTKISIFHY